ncbi:MAG: hypothetical protein ACI9H9_001939 [Pseudoalteromonas tetraodonis]|jgi:hypothetical protein|uniref:hypothetical protein n=1 Tax=Pseudoalteromonas TaxID=53246 RepID=UPI00366DCEE9
MNALTFIIICLLLLKGSYLEVVSPALYSLLNVLTFVAITFFLFLLIINKNIKVKLTNLLILLSLFFCMLVSSFYNFESIKSGGWNALMTIFVLFILSSIKKGSDGFNLYKIEKIYLFITITFLTISYILYILGAQFATSHTQYILSGPYLNQNTMSVNLFCLSIIGCLIVNEKNKYYLIPLIIIIFISIFLTMSRAGILFSIFVSLIFFGKNRFIIFLPFLPFLPAIGLYFLPTDFYSRFESKALEAGSSGRLEFVNQVFLDKSDNIGSLLFGIGVNNTTFELHGDTLSAHNSYISYFSDFGLLCFSLLFIYIILILRNVERKSMLYMIFLLGYAFFETTLFKGLSLSFFLFCLLANNEYKKTYTNNSI